MLRLISAGMSLVLFVTLSVSGVPTARASDGDPVSNLRRALLEATSQGVEITDEGSGNALSVDALLQGQMPSSVRTRLSAHRALRFAFTLAGTPALEVSLLESPSGRVLDAAILDLPQGENEAAAFQLALTRTLSSFSAEIPESEGSTNLLKVAGWTFIVMGGVLTVIFAATWISTIVKRDWNPIGRGIGVFGTVLGLILGAVGASLLASAESQE